MEPDGSEILEVAIADSVIEGGDWRLTFVDLLSLLLVFFILIYSMSSVKAVDWEKVKNILGDSFKSVKMIKDYNYSTELGVTKVNIKRGLDTDYLYTVLQNKIKDDSFLAKTVSIDNSGERLVIRMLNKTIFKGNTPVLSDEAELILFVMGESLQRIDNKIQVTGYYYGDIKGDNMEGWSIALSRATNVASQLRQMGNLSKLEAVVEKGEIVQKNKNIIDQIDIIISPYERKNQ